MSRTHLLAACFRALNDFLSGRLKSRNVHSEIVFALGSSNNVGDLSSFSFGVSILLSSLLIPLLSRSLKGVYPKNGFVSINLIRTHSS
jgi:EKC/KEOPS complex subunit CGI121/TPRKB